MFTLVNRVLNYFLLFPGISNKYWFHLFTQSNTNHLYNFQFMNFPTLLLSIKKMVITNVVAESILMSWFQNLKEAVYVSVHNNTLRQFINRSLLPFIEKIIRLTTLFRNGKQTGLGERISLKSKSTEYCFMKLYPSATPFFCSQLI